MVEGGTAHGSGTITKINLCVLGCPPAPVYKGARGRPPAWSLARLEGVLLPPGVGLLLGIGGGEEGSGGEEGKGGRRPPSLVLFGLGGWGARPPLPLSPLFSLLAHYGPITPRGVPVTPRCSGKIADFTRNDSEVQT